MSKAKLLLDVVSDMRSLADSLNAVAGAMMNAAEDTAENPKVDDGYSIPDEVAEMNRPAEEPKEKKPFMIDGKKFEVNATNTRKYLVNKSRQGFREEVRELLIKHGADKFCDIDPGEYEALLKDAEELCHAS